MGKGGHERALRILNMRSKYNFSPDTILLDSSTVIIQKYFLHISCSFINLLLSQSSQLQLGCVLVVNDTAQIEKA